MNITLKTPEKVLKFTEIFKNLKNLIDEINMVVMEEKLYMQGMDSTHALLFELEMNESERPSHKTRFEFENNSLKLRLNGFLRRRRKRRRRRGGGEGRGGEGRGGGGEGRRFVQS